METDLLDLEDYRQNISVFSDIIVNKRKSDKVRKLAQECLEINLDKMSKRLYSLCPRDQR